MAKNKTKADEYKDIFVKLHKYQHHGADNLIMLLTRYLRAKADYMASYIELVAERAGVSSTGPYHDHQQGHYDARRKGYDRD